MRLISELLSGKQNTKRSNNSGQGKLPCPAFFVPANDTCIVCRRAVGSSACKSCRNPSQIETGFCYSFDASKAPRIMDTIMFSCFGVAVCSSSSSASMS